MIDRKGDILVTILQLSGGEPDAAPAVLCELLAWCHANPGIDYVLLNTNGVSPGDRTDAFLDAGTMISAYGEPQLSSPSSMARRKAGSASCRGAPTCAMCDAAPSNAGGTLNILITLAMTVTPENLDFVWAWRWNSGSGFRHVRGAGARADASRYQSPHARSGYRCPFGLPIQWATAYRPPPEQVNSTVTGPHATAFEHCRHHSRRGRASARTSAPTRISTLLPLRRSWNLCATIGYLLKTGKGGGDALDLARRPSTSRRCRVFSGTKSATGSKTCCNAAAKSRAASASCSSQFELDEDNTFRLFIKALHGFGGPGTAGPHLQIAAAPTSSYWMGVARFLLPPLCWGLGHGRRTAESDSAPNHALS